jgi:3-dehydroquinate dehydratase-2
VSLLIVHGPNLSQLGTRDPAQYGTAAEDDLLADVRDELRDLGHDVAVELFTAESEGRIVERLHTARRDGTRALLINPGALTHYSWALRDALELLECPIVEVHLSQTHAREPFRRHSVVSPVAKVTITGAGALGYRLAARAAVALGGARG